MIFKPEQLKTLLEEFSRKNDVQQAVGELLFKENRLQPGPDGFQNGVMVYGPAEITAGEPLVPTAADKLLFQATCPSL